MKRKIYIFNGLLLILSAVVFAAAQMPTATRVPVHDRKKSAMENTSLKVELKPVAVKVEGEKILGIRSLAKGEPDKNELEAKAATDGATLILVLDEKNFARMEKYKLLKIDAPIMLNEETSAYLGSNVYALFGGEYEIETPENFSVVGPYHGRLRTYLNPGGEHRILRSILKTDALRVVEIPVSAAPLDAKPVVVRMKDGIVTNIKIFNEAEKLSGDAFKARASIVNTKLVLEFEKPISRERQTELKTVGSLIEDKETSEYLGNVCSCAEGKYVASNANSKNPTVTIPVIHARNRHRWLFHATHYKGPDDCPKW